MYTFPWCTLPDNGGLSACPAHCWTSRVWETLGNSYDGAYGQSCSAFVDVQDIWASEGTIQNFQYPSSNFVVNREYPLYWLKSQIPILYPVSGSRMWAEAQVLYYLLPNSLLNFQARQNSLFSSHVNFTFCQFVRHAERSFFHPSLQ